MADGFICGQKGGGSGKSEIIVTAPTGSTVTATCGTTVKTAAEKAGQWIFKNCDLGTWAIKATLGGQTAAKDVEIKEDGQLMRYYVELNFALNLYNAEFNDASKNQCIDITGGWKIVNDTSGSRWSFNSNGIKIEYVGSASASSLYTKIKVGFNRGFTQLKIHFRKYTNDSSDDSMFGLSETNNTRKDPAMVCEVSTSGIVNNTLSCDISTIKDGDYYVCFYSDGLTGEIDRIWLE